MRKLNFSEEEINEILIADKRIDRGEKLHSLSPEQEKIAKTGRLTGTRNAGAKKAKSRKENPQKALIISEIYNFLAENASFSPENLQILNKERMISFYFGEESYEITLIQKRKTKKGN